MRRLLVLAMALPLAACGFQPLYGDAGVTTRLSSIELVTPEGRAGQLLHERLDDALARTPGKPSLYRMTLTASEVRYPRGIRVDNVATRYELVLNVNYTLTEIATGAAVKTGATSVQVTYDSADQPYASIAAHEDGEDRAAAEAARRIEQQLAVWLAARQQAEK